MIKINNLTFSYPQAKEPALKDLSLSIERGDFILVTGASGAGKSTLLRCFNGLIPHFSGGVISGTVQVEGIDVINSSPRALSNKVGFVFQDPESQSVLDNVEDEIAFVLENAGIPEGEMHDRLNQVLDVLGLTSLRNRELTTLSGGERQKAAVAAAIVLDPSILVMDEPTSQLDWRSAEDLMQGATRLNQEFKTTIIIVEQRLDRVIPFAKRLLVMDSGQITSDDVIRDGAAIRVGLEQSDFGSKKGPSIWSYGQSAEPVLAAMVERIEKRNGAGIEGQNLSVQGRAKHQPLLSIRGLVCSYEEKRLLDAVSLDVDKGEAVALIGRNGTGKTTILKSVVGLVKPIQGEIIVDGRSILGRSTAYICREVAYLPQIPDDLLFAESVEQELEVTLSNHGLDSQKKRGMVEGTLASLELLPLRGKYPRDLSVGQRQRVAMGSVMVVGPKLILLDEPTRGLDSAFKSRLVEYWSRLIRNGHGLLLVTHDLELAGMIADRVLLLENGQVEEKYLGDRIIHRMSES